MKCLHICNGFNGSKVHENLYKVLSENGLDQTIYYFVRNEYYDLKCNFKEFELIGSEPLKIYHKILFKSKIEYLFKDISSKASLGDFDCVHATTLFSDGALALKIYKKYKIPYIVAIRGADVNAYIKLRIDLHTLAREILKNASKIIFISKSLEKNFYSLPLIKPLANELRLKSKVIFNGIDSFWLQNIIPKKEIEPIRILYIGNLSTNKNVIRLIKAVLHLKIKYPKIMLDIIGKNGKQESKIIQYSKKYKDTINYHGSIYNNKELQKHYSTAHIFAMASIGETFGLVYIEALSQGLPIIYSKNQGIDGSFSETIGEAVNPASLTSIIHGLQKIILNYSSYNLNFIDFSKFNWSLIAYEYLQIYSEIARKRE